MKRKIKRIYIDTWQFFGTDARGKNIVIKPFEPLKIIDGNGFYCIVKKRGRGQRRKYLIKTDLLQFDT